MPNCGSQPRKVAQTGPVKSGGKSLGRIRATVSFSKLAIPPAASAQAASRGMAQRRFGSS